MADTGGRDAGAALASWRERGADAFDPVRFRFIEALARRTAAQTGEARRLLDARLAAALADYGERLEQAPAEAPPSAPAGGEAGGLRELVARLAAHPGGRPPADAAAPPAAPGEPPGELKSLRYFRATWAKLSVDQQLAQALAQGPQNAGPLNSHRLVLQALELMRDAGPDYLNRFMAYADTLLWLDQAAGGPPAQRNAPRGDGVRKRPAGRSRPG